MFHQHPSSMLRQWSLGVLLVAAPMLCNAIAFCDLRDPTHQIYELFPQANSYRSLVETVDSNVKEDVGAQLPFTLHNRELGKHTLYVALQDGQPLGLVHVRSEASDWGLIEIVWSFDLELRVKDFRFQRCREAGCQALQADQFKQHLRGKNLEELRAELGEQADSGTALPDIAPDNQNLARAVIRSALKTLLVTQLVWGDQVDAVS